MDQNSTGANSVLFEQLKVETAAPYLAPEPHHGKRNEPAYVSRTLAVLARLRGLNPEVLAETTTNSARWLFGLSS